MKGVALALFIFASMVSIEAKSQDSLKQKLLGKRWFWHQVIKNNKREDAAEADKKHYILFKSKIVETLGPNGENYESPYTLDEQTRIATITIGGQKMKIVSVDAEEMRFYFLSDPETVYVTKRKAVQSQ
jgi:hypothetical protein